MGDVAEAQQEREAVANIERIAEDIYSNCSRIAHWGGDQPFDAVFDSLVAKVLNKAGHKTDNQIRTERRRKVFGVRESLKVFRRDGFKCRACGTDDELTIDHIQAWSHGGSDDLENLQTLCQHCNSSKGNR